MKTGGITVTGASRARPGLMKLPGLASSGLTTVVFSLGLSLSLSLGLCYSLGLGLSLG